MTPLKPTEQLKAEGWSDMQMEVLRLAFSEGVDLSHLDAAKWDERQMAQHYIARVSETDLSPIAQSLDWAGHYIKRPDGRRFVNIDPLKWNAAQMLELQWALDDGCDLTNLDPILWSEKQLAQQTLALQAGHDLSHIAHINPELWTWREMQEHRKALRRESAPGTTATKVARR